VGVRDPEEPLEASETVRPEAEPSAERRREASARSSERQRDDRREDRERRREPQQTAFESLGGWNPPASREAIHAALNSREGQSHE